jgi:hypothetical protein
VTLWLGLRGRADTRVALAAAKARADVARASIVPHLAMERAPVFDRGLDKYIAMVRNDGVGVAVVKSALLSFEQETMAWQPDPDWVRPRTISRLTRELSEPLVPTTSPPDVVGTLQVRYADVLDEREWILLIHTTGRSTPTASTVDITGMSRDPSVTPSTSRPRRGSRRG